MLVVWRDFGREEGAPRLPLQPIERPAEDTLEHSGKGNWLERGQMPAHADLGVVYHTGVGPGGDGLFGRHRCLEILAQMKKWYGPAEGLRSSEAALAATGLYYSFFLPFFLPFCLLLFIFLLSFISQRGRRVAGGELRHVAGSSGCGGDIRVLSYSKYSQYSMIKQTTTTRSAIGKRY